MVAEPVSMRNAQGGISILRSAMLCLYLAAVSPACLASQDQPIRFSHKRHSTLKIECKYCHPTVEQDALAGFPTAAKCMTCHRTVKPESPEIQRLAALPAGRKPYPSQRVYTLADYVFFSHARHRQAEIDCKRCHGDVGAQDVVTKQAPTSMKACVDCHKAHRATTACNACHELSQ